VHILPQTKCTISNGLAQVPRQRPGTSPAHTPGGEVTAGLASAGLSEVPATGSSHKPLVCTISKDMAERGLGSGKQLRGSN